MTFAFGLASVWMLNGLRSNEILIELPQIQSKFTIIHFKVKKMDSCFKIMSGHWNNETMENCNKKLS